MNSLKRTMTAVVLSGMGLCAHPRLVEAIHSLKRALY
jgi:hypothetical protein